MSPWTFSVPEGYFDDCVALAAQLPDGSLTTRPLFALTPRDYPSDSDSSSSSPSDQRPWARFTKHVAALNRSSPENVAYKIVFVTRHGQGYHNLKNEQVGDEAWDTHYSFLDGDEETTWFDAELTPHGISQATTLSAHWLASITADGLPIPQTLYTSPLTRCLQTSLYLLKPVMEAHGQPYHPLIKEDLRERWTLHTCDKRRSRSWIAEHWPEYRIEDGFAEEDQLTKLPREETDAEHKVRNLRALQEIFDSDEHQVISWTMHSLAMQSLLTSLGMTSFHVKPATTVALLVKGEKSA